MYKNLKVPANFPLSEIVEQENFGGDDDLDPNTRKIK